MFGIVTIFGRTARDWLVRLWITKGGGFYGLGYVVTFVSLEIGSVSDDFGESFGVQDFITSQLVSFIIRFSIESLINAVYAIVWPVFWLLGQPVFGLIGLLGAWVAFRYALYPFLENRLPELRAAREARSSASETDQSDR